MKQKIVHALLIFLLAFGACLCRAAAAQSRGKVREAVQAVTEGAAALARGDEVVARAAFARAVTADPTNVEAHTYLGLLADRAGDLREAERHFAAAVSSAPRLASARNNYGAILLRLNRVSEAAAQFEASLKLNPRQPSALVNLAQIRFAAGTVEDLRAARRLFEGALSLAPDTEIEHALIVITLRLGDRAAASRHYRDYAARVSEATASDIDVKRRAELGVALLEVKLFEEAVDELGHAVSADPSNVEAIVGLARAYRGRGETAAAGRLLESAVARGLDAAPIYAALAELYESINRVENAIPAMRLAVERDPHNEDYRFRYALMLIDTQAPKAAIIRLEEALPQFPRSLKLLFALGVAHLTAHQNDEAVRTFSRVIELDPKVAPALAYLGLAHAEQGRYPEALSFYERALAADEQAAAAHYLLADLLLKQASADQTRAETHLKRAVALDPSLVAARLALAKVHIRAERWAEAAGELEKIVGLDPNLAEAHYHLGRVYTRLKRADEAQGALSAFKRLSEAQKTQSQNERRDLVRRLAQVRF